MEGNFIVVSKTKAFESGDVCFGTVERIRKAGFDDLFESQNIFGVSFAMDWTQHFVPGKTYYAVESRAFFTPYKRVLASLQGLDIPTLQSDLVTALTTGLTTRPPYLRNVNVLSACHVLEFEEHDAPKELIFERTWDTVLAKWTPEKEEQLRARCEALNFHQHCDQHRDDEDPQLLGDDDDFDAQIRFRERKSLSGLHVLEPAQVKALHLIFHNNVAVVQGTPGTGKSFLGVKVLQLLLHNKVNLRCGPILVVSLTNHALDALLEDVIPFTKNVVRVGSRTKNPNISEFELGKKLHIRRTDYEQIVKQITKYHHVLQNVETENEFEHVADHFLEDREVRQQLPELRVIVEELHYLYMEYEKSQLLQRIPPAYQRGNEENICQQEIRKAEDELNNLTARMKQEGYDPSLQEDWDRAVQASRRFHNRAEIIRSLIDAITQIEKTISQLQTWKLDVQRLRQVHRKIQSFRMAIQSSTLRVKTMKEWRSLRKQGKSRHYGPDPTDKPPTPCVIIKPTEQNEEQRTLNEIEAQRREFDWEDDDGCVLPQLGNLGGLNLQQVPQDEQQRNRMLVREILSHQTNMTADDHETVYQIFLLEMRRIMTDKIRREFNRAKEMQTQYEHDRLEKCTEIFRYSDIIGATTAGIANVLPAIVQTNVKIILVEEAGEVLESHILATLTRNTQHLILIGDDRQLKPKVEEYLLEKEKNFATSLMERMIRMGTAQVTMNIQRRMHPELSLLTKDYYKNIKENDWHESVTIADHPITLTRRVIPGVFNNHRLIFVSHDHPEETIHNSGSPFNTFESQWCILVVMYLSRQENVNLEDIVVLCPYAAQVKQLLRDARAQNIPICSREKPNGVRIRTVDDFQGEEADIIILSLVRTERAGFLKSENRGCVELSRAKCALYVVGCTQVIETANPLLEKVVSTCRLQGSYYHETFPAVCLAHGKRLNFRNYKEFDKLVSEGGGCQTPCSFIHPGCRHRCSRRCHANDLDHKIPCAFPRDFVCKFCSGITTGVPCHAFSTYECQIMISSATACGHPVEAECCLWQKNDIKAIRSQCKSVCGQHMKCGHCCEQLCRTCASDPDHINAVKRCNKEDTRPRSSCGHVVTDECRFIDSTPCRAVCGVELPCGHACTGVCDDCTKSMEHAVCKVSKRKKFAGCNHECEVLCGEYDTAVCSHPCQQELIGCEHRCRGKCGECCRGGWAEHVPCQEPCGRILCCGHECKSVCANVCPPCDRQCENKCCHTSKPHSCQSCSKCEVKCREHCWWNCPHYMCTKLCFEICDRPVCNEPCPKKLECGHPCLGLCGEKCPSICSVCIQSLTKRQRETHCRHLKPYISSPEDIIEELLGEDPPRLYAMTDCECIFLVEDMDRIVEGMMDPSKEIMTARCTSCRARMVSTEGRYQMQLKTIRNNVNMVQCAIHDSYENVYETQQQMIKICNEKLKTFAPSATFVQLLEEIETRHPMREPQPPQRHEGQPYRIDEAIYKRYIESNHEVYQQLKDEARNSSLAAFRMVYIRQELESPMDYEKLYKFKKLLEIHIRCMMMQNDQPQANSFLASIPDNLSLPALQTIEEMSRIVFLYYRLTQLLLVATSHEMYSDITRHMHVIFPILASHEAPTNFWEHIGEPIEKWIDPLEKFFLLREQETIVDLAKVLQLTKGHAYKCPNGHLYFIGECGGAMETSRCPDCGVTIGGHNHRVAEGNENVNVVNGEEPAYGYNLGIPPPRPI